jgi:DNA-binding transcriptional regulator YdaS (Cro superfamily)
MDPQITAEDRRRFADQLGLHEQYLYQCLTGRREMKPSEAVRAEIETGGALKRQMLCQHTYAAIWPELAKQPAKWDGKERRKAGPCTKTDRPTGNAGTEGRG